MKQVIGVFGQSGAGKSTFCSFLKNLGVTIIDADQIGKTILDPGTPALNQVVEVFGKDILLPDGSLHRKKLGAIVFQDKKELEKLNNITLNRLEEEMFKELEGASGMIAIDCALLPQTRLISLCQEKVYVKSDLNLQAKRIMERDGLSEKAALERIHSQDMAASEVATMIIENNGDLESLKKEAEKLYRRMCND